MLVCLDVILWVTDLRNYDVWWFIVLCYTFEVTWYIVGKGNPPNPWTLFPHKQWGVHSIDFFPHQNIPVDEDVKTLGWHWFIFCFDLIFCPWLIKISLAHQTILTFLFCRVLENLLLFLHLISNQVVNLK